MIAATEDEISGAESIALTQARRARIAASFEKRLQSLPARIAERSRPVTPALLAEKLTKRYGSVDAVQDVSFTIARGETSRAPRFKRGGQDDDDRHDHGSSHALAGAGARVRT